MSFVTQFIKSIVDKTQSDQDQALKNEIETLSKAIDKKENTARKSALSAPDSDDDSSPVSSKYKIRLSSKVKTVSGICLHASFD